MQKIPSALILFGFLFALLLFDSYGGGGQDIELVDEISVDPAANFQGVPTSFTVTEDFIFLFTDQSGTVKILQLEQDGKFLKFLDNLGPSFAGGQFIQPRYVDYNRDESKVTVIDYGGRNILVFDRRGKDVFELIKNIPCPKFGYDTRFINKDELVISGYIYDKANYPYDLYKRNIWNEELNFLLPSHEKYNLKNFEEYNREYRIEQRLPAVGIKGYIDIQGDNLFYVWEGALRIFKLNVGVAPNMRTKKEEPFGHATYYYTKPDKNKLGELYAKGQFPETWKEKETMSYVTDIFATPRHVLLVYKTGKNKKNTSSTFRLQVYTVEGDYLEDILILGDPGQQMWFDKNEYDLYALSEKHGKGGKGFTILKYEINK